MNLRVYSSFVPSVLWIHHNKALSEDEWILQRNLLVILWSPSDPRPQFCFVLELQPKKNEILRQTSVLWKICKHQDIIFLAYFPTLLFIWHSCGVCTYRAGAMDVFISCTYVVYVLYGYYFFFFEHKTTPESVHVWMKSVPLPYHSAFQWLTLYTNSPVSRACCSSSGALEANRFL